MKVTLIILILILWVLYGYACYLSGKNKRCNKPEKDTIPKKQISKNKGNTKEEEDLKKDLEFLFSYDGSL